MNGFGDHGLDEKAFGEKGSNIVQAFDAFRKYTDSNPGIISRPEQLAFYNLFPLKSFN